MSYPDIHTEDFLPDLLVRKELYMLRNDPEHNFRAPPGEVVLDFPRGAPPLRVHSHQLFVRNFESPNTPYPRLHLQHSTGSGKTLAAVTIAQEFIKVYKKLYAGSSARIMGRRQYGELERTMPMVFVLGFGGTKGAFVRELLKYPEFGFINHVEKEELLKRQSLAAAGLPDDIKSYKDYYSQIKKRITNKSRGGFYKFFGYDEFVNKLFTSSEIKLTDLEAEVVSTGAIDAPTLEEIISDYISRGKIQVNQLFLTVFGNNSLLICDEIHNTYNMNIKNNRGVAIQYLLDTVPGVRFLSLSATPINNLPTEAIELVNYLVPEKKITKREFFSNSRTLLPGKLEELGLLTRGRISFLQDISERYYPRRVWAGETMKLPAAVGDLPAGAAVPYLKFIECPMSEFHQRTYNAYVDDVIRGRTDVAAPADVPGANTYHSIPTDGYCIYDMVFPNPDSDTVGLFRSGEVRNKLGSASQTWRDQNKILMKKLSTGSSVATGDFLLAASIAKYSTKYARLVALVLDIVKSAGGNAEKGRKIMIFHNWIKMSGALQIQELLRTNGFIDEHSEPVSSTICCLCGEPLSAHGTGQRAHDFRPCRIIMAHSEIDKATMDQSLAKYGAADNAHGGNYMILIGSRIVKESYDFKDIQELIILSLPVNIPTLLQVFGRCIRKLSHANLPPEQWQVRISILVSTANTSVRGSGAASTDPVAPEVRRYVDKLADYAVIQKIEREFNRNAIDADINRDTNMPPELLREYFPDGADVPPRALLGNLYFDPAVRVPYYKPGELNLSTFTAYKFYEEEIAAITYVIKRLFMTRPVWTYEELWAATRSPPVGLEVNPKFFLENNFIIALHGLVEHTTGLVVAGRKQSAASLLEHVLDPSDRFVYAGGTRHKIEQIGKYYILFPMASPMPNPLNAFYVERAAYARDRERAMIKEAVETSDRVIVDVETYLRPITHTAGVRVSIDDFIKESKLGANYAIKRAQFIEQFDIDHVDILPFLWNYSAAFQMAFVEEAIIAAVTGTTEGAPTDLYKEVIHLLDKFHVIIYPAELRKYKDMQKQYKYGLPEVTSSTPMGYTTTKTVKLFDPQIGAMANTEPAGTAYSGRWFEVNKISLNRQPNYKENAVIVGYLESSPDYMKFKMRRPAQEIRNIIHKDIQAKKQSALTSGAMSMRAIQADTRLIERGIVCTTKNKYELLQIIASLGISVSKLCTGEIRIRNLCEIIKRKLIDNEIKERQRDSRVKYLYSWWDEMVDLSMYI